MRLINVHGVRCRRNKHANRCIHVTRRFIQNNQSINNSVSICLAFSHFVSVSVCLDFPFEVLFIFRNNAKQMNSIARKLKLVRNSLEVDAFCLLMKLVHFVVSLEFDFSIMQASTIYIFTIFFWLFLGWKQCDQNKQCVNNSPPAKPYPANHQLYYVCEQDFVILGSCPDGMVISYICFLSTTRCLIPICNWILASKIDSFSLLSFWTSYRRNSIRNHRNASREIGCHVA